MSCSYFVLNVWLLIQTYLVFIVNVIISIIEIKCSSLFLIWWRNSKGYRGGGEAWEVKVLEMVGTKRNGRGYETMPS